ncbi:MAG: hypothetical protein HQ511_00480 [Rhodospirillales bacterium]|nr:hypothetical protein [Rhodospirillales bacterium]
MTGDSGGNSNGDQVTGLDAFDIPYSKQVVLQEVAYESGMTLLRVRIKEGSRFTIVELDPDSAARWGKTLTQWAAAHAPQQP